MILVINQKESAALALHLSIMRKNYKKLFKRDYKDNRDVLMQSYDYILETAKEALESGNEAYEVHMDGIDLDVLYAFLESYLNKLYELDLNEEMLEQLDIILTLYHRCSELVAA